MTAPASHFEIIVTTHPDCSVCLQFANDAAVMASATGSTGATYGTEKSLVAPPPGFVAHSATVRRIREENMVILHDPQHAVVEDLIKSLTIDLAEVDNGGNYNSLLTVLSTARRLLRDAQYAVEA